MKAIELHRFGDLESLRSANLPNPRLEPGQVVVRVESVSFNPVDLWILDGRLGGSLPLIPGRDLAGTVVEVAPNDRGLRVGDPVYARLPWPLGSYAEFVSLPQAFVARAPASIPLSHASAIPVVGLTALHCVERAHGLQDSDVFVTGASGGVGSFAIELLKTKGVRRIFATAGTADSLSYLTEHLGLARENILDYRDANLLSVLRSRSASIAACFDFAGGAMKKLCFDVATPGGFVASIVEEPANFDLNLWDEARSPMICKSLTFHFEQLGAYGVRDRPETWETYGRDLSRLAKMVDQKTLRMPKIHTMGSFSIETIVSAYSRLSSRHSFGKMIMHGWTPS